MSLDIPYVRTPGPDGREITGQVDFSQVPRFAGPGTFAGLPRLADVGESAAGVIGIPFDSGVTYRPGARFGPEGIRSASHLIRPHHVELDSFPFAKHQVADVGNLAVTPFGIETAIDAMVTGLTAARERAGKLVILGGDHTVAYPSIKTLFDKHGPISVLHFDAHIDTFGTYFGASTHHGTPFRRAAEEGLLDPEGCMHIGIRGSLYDHHDLSDDRALGFQTVHASEFLTTGLHGIADQMRARLGDRPVYVSVDIDVLDPAFAPGTGTPEPGGLSSRELLFLIRSLAPLKVVGADVVEVAPSYDHANVTSLAAAHVAYEFLSIWGL
ncbi:agmatinase [Leucobacter sp. cx-328]|uniref:agmatinase n=1 Tax=unclassified Leucobacter TaxID=2621730 RepID=UPI00165DAC2D|nr:MULTISPECIES: agmatinase [unclassified Leucobacter]MBC9943750.1 agmatinase [Leucobacter sp. cx-328]